MRFVNQNNGIVRSDSIKEFLVLLPVLEHRSNPVPARDPCARLRVRGTLSDPCGNAFGVGARLKPAGKLLHARKKRMDVRIVKTGKQGLAMHIHAPGGRTGMVRHLFVGPHRDNHAVGHGHGLFPAARRIDLRVVIKLRCCVRSQVIAIMGDGRTGNQRKSSSGEIMYIFHTVYSLSMVLLLNTGP